ncbi:MAG: hypothetical protein ACF8Q5_03290 [Phycisphaerales bacterium JB040]
MSTRGDRHALLVIGLALTVPVLAWWRFVAPVRESRAAVQIQTRALLDEREGLRAAQEGHSVEGSERVRAVRAVRLALESLPGATPGASEVYRRVEDAASRAGVRVVRIEPGSESDPRTGVGPLELMSVETSRRSYRLDFESPVVAVPFFIGLVQEIDGAVEIRETRLQAVPGRADRTTGTLVFELLGVRAADAPADGEGSP